MRFAFAGRQVRRSHVPVHRSEEHQLDGGTRSLDLENRRGSDLLLQPARPEQGRRHQHDRQRLLQGSLPRAADGIRGGGAEAVGGELGGERGMRSALERDKEFWRMIKERRHELTIPWEQAKAELLKGKSTEARSRRTKKPKRSST